MSRLDSFIRRMHAQRACLDQAMARVAGLDGPALELGLGNGRTYDHLRAGMPGREIFVFERRVAAHPDCVPDAAHLLLGDIAETLPAAAARIGRPAVLAHCDIGSGDKAAGVALAAWLAPRLAALLAPGAVVIADQEMPAPVLKPTALPDGVKPGRYHIYLHRPNT